MKFTDRQIKELKPKTTRYEVWEDNGKGLGVRVSSKGTKSWIYMYRTDGRARRMTLGNYPKMSVAEAHKKHAEARELVAHGKDPGEKIVKQRESERTALTVNVWAEEYIEKHAKPNKRSWANDQEMLQRNVVPRWGRRKAKDINRRDITLLLDDIVDRGAPICANRVLSLLSKMYNFSISRGDLEYNPCTAIKKPSKENQRDRVLSEDEIYKFWYGLDNASIHENIRLALKFQLVTAQRKGEVLQAQWEHIDLKSGWWIIPATIAKNKNEHRVYLSSLARELLAKAKENNSADWVFPSPLGNKQLNDCALNRAITRNMDKIGIEKKFVTHDLRRTAASLMTSIGVSRIVVSKILNHVDGKVTAIYDRHSYDLEKQNAMEAWADKLKNILNLMGNEKITFIGVQKK